VRNTTTGENALWEANADGTNSHPLLPGWKGAENPCCGIWTRDGRYYVFEATGNIWALPEARFLQRRPSEPVQLTFGPLLFSGVMPSRDGKRLFVVGDQRKGRLARYDAGTKQFVPYLDELSRASRVGRCRGRLHGVSGGHAVAQPDGWQRAAAINLFTDARRTPAVVT
jgi:hypothetical protein